MTVQLHFLLKGGPHGAHAIDDSFGHVSGDCRIGVGCLFVTGDRGLGRGRIDAIDGQRRQRAGCGREAGRDWRSERPNRIGRS